MIDVYTATKDTCNYCCRVEYAFTFTEDYPGWGHTYIYSLSMYIHREIHSES